MFFCSFSIDITVLLFQLLHLFFFFFYKYLGNTYYNTYICVTIYIIYTSVCVYFYNKFIYVHTGLPGLPSCYLSASLILNISLYEDARKCCLKANTHNAFIAEGNRCYQRKLKFSKWRKIWNTNILQDLHAKSRKFVHKLIFLTNLR